MITEAIETKLYSYLRNRIVKTKGAIFHAIGGIADHIHIVVTIKPTIRIDEWLGRLKGSSSHEMGKSVAWQHGYGVVSFGTKALPWVVNYVLNQKEHHRRGDIYERLETIEADDG